MLSEALLGIARIMYVGSMKVTNEFYNENNKFQDFNKVEQAAPKIDRI